MDSLPRGAQRRTLVHLRERSLCCCDKGTFTGISFACAGEPTHLALNNFHVTGEAPGDHWLVYGLVHPAYVRELASLIIFRQQVCQCRLGL